MSPELPPFDDMHAGKGCPFCNRQDVNEFWFKVADLSTSSFYLERNQTYRGYCILVFSGRHVNGIEMLNPAEHVAFSNDLHKVAQAIFKATGADHMNYATLGNVIPHLHYHIIPRYKNDPRWGAPVWASNLQDMEKTVLTLEQYHEIIEKIRQYL